MAMFSSYLCVLPVGRDASHSINSFLTQAHSLCSWLNMCIYNIFLYMPRIKCQLSSQLNTWTKNYVSFLKWLVESWVFSVFVNNQTHMLAMPEFIPAEFIQRCTYSCTRMCTDMRLHRPILTMAHTYMNTCGHTIAHNKLRTDLLVLKRFVESKCTS